MKQITVTIEFTEEILGTTPGDKEIFSTYIASNGPNAASIEEEIAAHGEDEIEKKKMTVFMKDKGKPFLWDYQVKGFFKDACGMLRDISDYKSSKLKAYKKTVDGKIFVYPRQIPIQAKGELGICQRPLRANTPLGEKVALASSETVPSGSIMVFKVLMLDDHLEPIIREWLDYGKYRGIGQWRNSGKGKFIVKSIE